MRRLKRATGLVGAIVLGLAVGQVHAQPDLKPVSFKRFVRLLDRTTAQCRVEKTYRQPMTMEAVDSNRRPSPFSEAHEACRGTVNAAEILRHTVEGTVRIDTVKREANASVTVSGSVVGRSFPLGKYRTPDEREAIALAKETLGRIRENQRIPRDYGDGPVNKLNKRRSLKRARACVTAATKAANEKAQVRKLEYERISVTVYIDAARVRDLDIPKLAQAKYAKLNLLPLHFQIAYARPELSLPPVVNKLSFHCLDVGKKFKSP